MLYALFSPLPHGSESVLSFISTASRDLQSSNGFAERRLLGICCTHGIREGSAELAVSGLSFGSKRIGPIIGRIGRKLWRKLRRSYCQVDKYRYELWSQ